MVLKVITMFYIQLIFIFLLNSTIAEEDNSETNFNITIHNETEYDENLTSSEVIIDENDQLVPLPFTSQRFRRQPGFSIIKHKPVLASNAPRGGRVKSPRPVYGPPNFNSGKPISFYKSQSTPTSFSYDKPRQFINYGPPSYNNGLREKPEYLIINNGDKFNSDFVYIDDEKNKGSLGYILPSGNGNKNWEYMIYETAYNRPGNFRHLNFRALIPNKIPPYQTKPHKFYGIPGLDFKSIFGENNKTGKAKIELSEYDINPYPPAKILQIPKDSSPGSFKIGFIGPSYLPPSDFHNDWNKTTDSDDDLSIEFEYPTPQLFDNSKLPIGDIPKHPNFDYQKSSYEVPIYEAEPFTSMSTEPQIIYPPSLYDIYNDEKFSTIIKGTPKKFELQFPQKFIQDDSNQIKITSKGGGAEEKKNAIDFARFVSTLQSLGASLETISEPPAALVIEQTTTTSATIEKQKKKRKRTRVSSIKRHADEISTLKKMLIETNQDMETTTLAYKYIVPTTTLAFRNNTPPTTTLAYRHIEPSRSTITNRSSNNTRSNFGLSTTTSIKPTQKMREREIRSWESARVNKTQEKTEEKPVQVISIQRSRSHSYYDGTIAPATIRRLTPCTEKPNDKTTKYDRLPRKESAADFRYRRPK